MAPQLNFTILNSVALLDDFTPAPFPATPRTAGTLTLRLPPPPPPSSSSSSSSSLPPPPPLPPPPLSPFSASSYSSSPLHLPPPTIFLFHLPPFSSSSSSTSPHFPLLFLLRLRLFLPTPPFPLSPTTRAHHVNLGRKEVDHEEEMIGKKKGGRDRSKRKRGEENEEGGVRIREEREEEGGGVGGKDRKEREEVGIGKKEKGGGGRDWEERGGEGRDWEERGGGGGGGDREGGGMRSLLDAGKRRGKIVQNGHAVTNREVEGPSSEKKKFRGHNVKAGIV